MTALFIIAAFLLLIIVLLLLPVSVHMRFEGDFFLKIKIAGIKVYDVKPGQDIEKPKPADTESDTQAEKQEKKLFERLKKKLGFTGAVKEIAAFARKLLERLGGTLKHVYFKKLRLNITVAGSDAAETAIEYGAVCTVVYPVLSYLSTLVHIKMKQINIASDFNSGKSEFSFSGIVSTRVLVLLTALFGVFKEYNNFKARNEL